MPSEKVLSCPDGAVQQGRPEDRVVPQPVRAREVHAALLAQQLGAGASAAALLAPARPAPAPDLAGHGRGLHVQVVAGDPANPVMVPPVHPRSHPGVVRLAPVLNRLAVQEVVPYRIEECLESLPVAEGAVEAPSRHSDRLEVFQREMPALAGREERPRGGALHTARPGEELQPGPARLVAQEGEHRVPDPRHAPGEQRAPRGPVGGPVRATAAAGRRARRRASSTSSFRRPLLR
mmetsp:Transcript_5753/g.11644  ORF Transcript_5753/g.11644 Transcript_5753/m.11644 type:complete len:235 (+) Transcript_5753:331-1035(+)